MLFHTLLHWALYTLHFRNPNNISRPVSSFITIRYGYSTASKAAAGCTCLRQLQEFESQGRNVPKTTRTPIMIRDADRLAFKCDGTQPTCGRCTGYGYACRWNQADGKKSILEGGRADLDWLSMDVDGQKLRDAITGYDNLIGDLRKNLSSDDCKMVDLRLASIQLPNHVVNQVGSGGNITPPSPEQPVAGNRSSIPVQRYLGEASDIRFFHAMESTFGQQAGLDQQVDGASEGRVDSYEQEEIRPEVSDHNEGCLPHRATADNLVNIYFSTIHIAYPFISEPDFRTTYEKFWQSESLEGFRGPWLSVLCECHLIYSRKPRGVNKICTPR
jgi:hypothetical protein